MRCFKLISNKFATENTNPDGAGGNPEKEYMKISHSKLFEIIAHSEIFLIDYAI